MTAIVECIKLNDELVSEVRNVTKNIPHWLFSNKTTLHTNWIMKFIMHFSTNRNPLAARWIWGLANLNCRFYTNRINATTHSGIHFVVALLENGVCHGKLTNALTIDILLLEVELQAPYSCRAKALWCQTRQIMMAGIGWQRTSFCEAWKTKNYGNASWAVASWRKWVKIREFEHSKMSVLERFKYSKYFLKVFSKKGQK